MTRLFERMQAGGGDAGLAAVTALMEEYHRDGKVDDVAMALWRRADEQQGARLGEEEEGAEDEGWEWSASSERT